MKILSLYYSRTQVFSVQTNTLVPGAGLEPARPFKGHRILSPACLPIPPSWRKLLYKKASAIYTTTYLDKGNSY